MRCEFGRLILHSCDLDPQSRGMSSSEAVAHMLWPCIGRMPTLVDSTEATAYQRALDPILGFNYWSFIVWSRNTISEAVRCQLKSRCPVMVPDY